MPEGGKDPACANLSDQGQEHGAVLTHGIVAIDLGEAHEGQLDRVPCDNPYANPVVRGQLVGGRLRGLHVDLGAGHRRDGQRGAVARAAGDGYETRGWWRIAPGGCAQTLSAQLTSNETYVYAQLIDADALRPLAGGTEAFCIPPARFTSQTRSECTNSGFQPALFRAAPAPEDGGSVMRLDLNDFEEPLP